MTSRDENGVLTGDLQYDVGFPAKILSNITPVYYPCSKCGHPTLHVALEQPTGLAIKIPFMRTPLASTGKEYGLACNECSMTAGVSGKAVIDKLERRVVPAEVCRALDSFLEAIPGAVPAYSPGFTQFFLSLFKGDTTFLATCLAVYRRE